jgi:hypothetical protein
MNEAAVALLWELGKLGLQQYLIYARMAGRTAEEINAEFNEARIRFEQRSPEDLLPPPK